MPCDSRHICEWIGCSAQAAYDYASAPEHLPDWARGLASAVERVDDRWFVESPMGRVGVVFAPHNEFGVLDQHVTLSSGEVFYNPMRVVQHGDGCEVVFTVRRQAGMSDAEFERDAAAVAADLASLKRVLESRHAT